MLCDYGFSIGHRERLCIVAEHSVWNFFTYAYKLSGGRLSPRELPNLTFTLTLIHPASPLHRATRWRYECLSWADVSTSSLVNTILWRSFFTTSLQFILGLPGLLVNPATSQCSAYFGMRTSSILVTWPSHRILLSRITFSRSICPVCRTIVIHNAVVV